MKSVLIISSTSGFLSKFEMDNVEILIDMGYNVHYASNITEPDHRYKQEQLDALGVKCHNISIARSPYMFRMNWHAWKQLRSIIKSENIQLIHCHTPVGGMLGRLAVCFLRNRPEVIYTAHGFHFYKSAPFKDNIIYYTVERFLALFSDAIILINREDYGKAVGFRLRKGGKVYQIPGIGLDMEHFTYATDECREKARKELNILNDEFFLISIGELNQNKNHEIVLKAISRLKEQQKLPESFRYGLCGDGFYFDKLNYEIYELGLSDIVTMYGYCDDVRKYISAADYSVFPSRREGLGMAALESLAMGVPVIASDNRGTREYMKNGINGFVFQWNDVDSLCQVLQDVFTMRIDAQEKMKLSCRDTVGKFDRKITHNLMMKIYDDIDRKLRQ